MKGSYSKVFTRNQSAGRRHISVISHEKRSQPKTNHQESNPKTKMKDLLKSSYALLRQQNDALLLKLKKNNRKIEEQKQKLCHCEARIQALELLQHQNQFKPMGQQSTKQSEEGLRSSRKNYERLVRQSQQLAKKTLEKYRSLEQDYEQYRRQVQSIMKKLNKQNAKLKIERAKSTIEITESRSINQRGISQQSSREVSCTKDVSCTKKDNSYRKNIAQEIESLTNKIVDLEGREGEWQSKSAEWAKKQSQWLKKETELKQMLNEITKRINKLSNGSSEGDKECQQWKASYEKQVLKNKLRSKRRKLITQQWSAVFKDFLTESSSLAEQIKSMRCLFYKMVQLQTVQ